jgi:aminoglycoside 3-N-acetyltransferase
MPTFTYKTMLIPEAGPPDNAMKYGRGKDTNRMTEFYRPDMPADRMMGAVAESLRRHPGARRSHHPILSFAGLNADRALDAQSLAEPMAPIQVLTEAWGWVLLLGVDYRANTSVHYAERKAGRKQFIRWALTPKGSCECPGFPGCSDGFPALAPRLEAFTRRVQVGRAAIQAISLPDLVEAASRWIASDPLALLCERLDCGRCQAIRVVYSSRLRR